MKLGALWFKMQKNYTQARTGIREKESPLELAILSDYLIYNVDGTFIKKYAKSWEDYKKVVIADFFIGMGASKESVNHLMIIHDKVKDFTEVLCYSCFFQKMNDEYGLKFEATSSKDYKKRDLKNEFVSSTIESLIECPYFREMCDVAKNMADIKTLITLDAYCDGFNVSTIRNFGSIEKAFISHLSEKLDESGYIKRYESLKKYGETSMALKYLDHGFKNLKNPIFKLKEMLHYYNRGNIPKAYALSTEFINAGYKDYNVYMLTGDIECELKEYRHAMKNYSKAIMINPRDPSAWQKKIKIVTESKSIFSVLKEERIQKIINLAQTHGVHLQNPMGVVQ